MTDVVDAGRLLALVDAFDETRVAVFGDLIVDEFIYGELSRVSREAPVLILDYDSTEIVPGGAGNAASNVAALGGAPVAVGVAGRDEAGRRLLKVMRRHVDVGGISRPAGYRTPTKTRILAGGVHSAKQQVVRIDRGTRPTFTDAERRAIESRLATSLRGRRRAPRLRLRHGLGDARRHRARAHAGSPGGPARVHRCSSTRATRCSVSAA